MDYDIKKGWFKNVEGDLLPAMIKEVFGSVDTDGEYYVSSYGVMSVVKIRVVSKDKMEIITETSKVGLTDDAILDSKRRLNIFAEKATGFDAKARMKRAQQKAKKGNM